MGFTRTQLRRYPLRRGAAKHDNIEQRVGAEPVGAVHRYARRLSDRHQSGHDRFRIVAPLCHDLAVQIGRYPAHIVVNGG